MDWFKMEARYWDDLAVTGAGERAEVLFIRSIAFSTEKETNGFVPTHQLNRFGLPGAKQRANSLVEHGLWKPVKGGWQIKSYDRIQEEVVKIAKRKKAEADRKRQAYYDKRVSAESAADIPADTPHESPEDSRKSPSLVSGYETFSEVEIEIRDLSPQPPASGGRRCTRHKARPKANCADCQLPANPTIIGPACGKCSPSRRLEDEHGGDLGPCPDCHPSRRTA